MSGFSARMTDRGRGAGPIGVRRCHVALAWFLARFLARTPAALRPVLTGTFMRYVSASVIALVADAGSFLFLLHCAMPAAMAAATGFMLGTGVHWLVSSRVMFVTGVAAHGPQRRAQIALFIGSALIGLVLTTLIVSGAVVLAINPRLGKLVAIAVSFVVTSALRHVLIFGKSQIA